MTIRARLLGLGFPEADGVAFGILHPRESTGGNVHGRNEHLGTQRFCLFEIASHVIDADVENRVVLRFMAEGGNVAGDAAGVNGGKTNVAAVPAVTLRKVRLFMVFSDVKNSGAHSTTCAGKLVGLRNFQQTSKGLLKNPNSGSAEIKPGFPQITSGGRSHPM